MTRSLRGCKAAAAYATATNPCHCRGTRKLAQSGVGRECHGDSGKCHELELRPRTVVVTGPTGGGPGSAAAHGPDFRVALMN